MLKEYASVRGAEKRCVISSRPKRVERIVPLARMSTRFFGAHGKLCFRLGRHVLFLINAPS